VSVYVCVCGIIRQRGVDACAAMVRGQGLHHGQPPCIPCHAPVLTSRYDYVTGCVCVCVCLTDPTDRLIVATAQQAEEVSWRVGGREAGAYRSAEGLTFLKIRDAGHMVGHGLALTRTWVIYPSRSSPSVDRGRDAASGGVNLYSGADGRAGGCTGDGQYLHQGGVQAIALGQA
jgi:hypothetical protein